MSFVEGIGTAGVDVADPTFAMCVTAMLLLVACIFALPAFAAALSLLRTQGLARFFSHLLRRRHS